MGIDCPPGIGPEMVGQVVTEPVVDIQIEVEIAWPNPSDFTRSKMLHRSECFQGAATINACRFGSRLVVKNDGNALDVHESSLAIWKSQPTLLPTLCQ
jgi:hypothetical protein